MRLAALAVVAACGGTSSATGRSNSDSDSAERTERPVTRSSKASSEEPRPPGDLVPPPASEPEDTPPVPTERTEPIGDLDQAKDAFSKGQFGALRTYLESIAQATPNANQPDLTELRYRLDLMEGKYAELVSAKPKTDEQRRLRAHALLRLGKWEGAEKEFAALAESSPQARRAWADLLAKTGREAQARAQWMAIIEAYNEDAIKDDDAIGLWQVAVAAHNLGAYRDANDAFAMATKANPALPGVQVDWAALFLEKYDAGHAEESLRQALKSNPSHADAHALMAAVKAEQGMRFDDVSAYAERALEINPNHIGAMMELASVALRDKRLKDVAQWLRKARSVNPRSRKAASMEAVRSFVFDETAKFDRVSKELRRQDRRSRYFARMLIAHAEWEHRYQEMVDFARTTLASDPDNHAMRATLGLNLLRTGKEDEGLAELRSAWKRDRYNVRVYNTLNLYDDVLSKHYLRQKKSPFIFRFEKSEAERLEQHVPPLLKNAYVDMKKRYGFVPEGPIEIDLLADSEHFAVRTVGLPRLGVQGVCFGKLITALSPKAAAFNWGQILYHELSHVFHLQMSNNRVPRWFTEGLAEYETAIARENWKRHHDRDLWKALKDNKIPSIEFFDRAFTQINSAYELVVAYYASYRLVHYLIDTHGFEFVPKLLSGWKKGENSVALIERILEKKIAQIDSDYRAYLRKDLARFADVPELDFAKLRGNYAALKSASKTFPDEVGVWELLIRELADKKSSQEYARAVQRAAELQPHSRQAWLRWIELLHETKNWDVLREAAKFAILVDPHNLRVHELLQAAKEKRAAKAPK